MNVIEIATSIPTIIDTATATIESIDKAIPAVDTLFPGCRCRCQDGLCRRAGRCQATGYRAEKPVRGRAEAGQLTHINFKIGGSHHSGPPVFFCVCGSINHEKFWLF